MRPNYSAEEVQALIEGYAQLREKAGTARGLRYLVALADLVPVLKRLRKDYRNIVYLLGLMGYTQDEVARMLDISQPAVHKRYRLAIEEITYQINGRLD